MTAVKIANNKLSKTRMSSKTTVVGGETLEHSLHSLPTQMTNWYTPKNNPCKLKRAMYNCKKKKYKM